MARAKRARRGLTASLAAVSILLGARAALAEVPVCVEVAAPAAELEGVRKLVRTELDRHPSHRVAFADCRSHLRVELFEAAGARYLTAQIDREVPVRYVIKDPLELGARLTDAVSLVLHNDPTYLTEDITHYSSLQRLSHSVLARGRFMFRLETFEAISNAGSAAVFASGGAFSVTRGSGNWQVLGRMYLGGAFSPTGKSGRALEILTGADAGLTYELFDKASWSPYLTGCLGLQFLRYAGRDETHALVRAQHVGATVSARVGVRFFRWTNFDLDLFAQAYAPLFLTSDETGSLFGDKGIYTPTLQLGLGVGF
jgi:hypothetical protein